MDNKILVTGGDGRFAKKYNKSVKKAKLNTNSKFPLNQTMNLSKLKNF